MKKKSINAKRIQQQLDMIFNILALVFDPLYQALLDSLQPYKDACEELQTKAESLRAKLAIYRKLLKSLAEAKKEARVILAQAAFPIMSLTRSYCLKNGLNDEASQLDFTLAQLKNMPFSVLISKMQIAIPIVQSLLGNLTAYDITAPMVTQWNDKLQNLINLMSDPHNAIQQRKAMGKTIMAETSALLKFFNEQPCTLVAKFIDSNPEYYISFQNIKRIGTGNIHHTRLLAHCQTELGAPVFGITVTVDQYTDPVTQKTYAAASAATDANGDAEVKGFFAANRTVTLSGPNIETTAFPALDFQRGKTTAHSFTVRPSFENLPAPQQQETTENA
ncbi:MAG TPA: hypothetical protein VJY62_06710 [Bacteroidia bacterium]|nr:hypothetical protein [Bacteroidia bacterium]